jgi:hypothetical protein
MLRQYFWYSKFQLQQQKMNGEKLLPERKRSEWNIIKLFISCRKKIASRLFIQFKKISLIKWLI